MAYDLNTAKRLIQQRGIQPPPGADFDTWAMQWFENALNAGDPEIVRAAGGYAAEENAGGIADWQGAADPQTWLGQRKPTPRELRKYARMTGQSEDYQRFDDRQLAAWINQSWDPSRGAFLNDFGDVVEKPTESGPNSQAAGYATGERSSGRGGGGGGGGGAQVAGGSPAVDPRTTDRYLLNSPLAQLLANQGGFLRQFDRNPNDDKAGVMGGAMQGGSIWWRPTERNIGGWNVPVGDPTGAWRVGGNMPEPGAPTGTVLPGGASGGRGTTGGPALDRPFVGGPLVGGGQVGITGTGLPGKGTTGAPLGGLTTNPLTNTMVGLQSGTSGLQALQPGGLSSYMSKITQPYQRRAGAKRPGSWF